MSEYFEAEGIKLEAQRLVCSMKEERLEKERAELEGEVEKERAEMEAEIKKTRDQLEKKMEEKAKRLEIREDAVFIKETAFADMQMEVLKLESQKSKLQLEIKTTMLAVVRMKREAEEASGRFQPSKKKQKKA